jgi:hypothetical protein
LLIHLLHSLPIVLDTWILLLTAITKAYGGSKSTRP